MRKKLAAIALVLAVVVTALTRGAGVASAEDHFPCDAQKKVSFASGFWQQCPLHGLLFDRVPVFKKPVSYNGVGKMPAPVGWLKGTANQFFAFQLLGTDPEIDRKPFVHPLHKDWRNNWWARTKADGGPFGWVPEVFFKGGTNNEPDGKLIIHRFARDSESR